MDRTVSLTYHGPDEIRVIKDMEDGSGVFTFKRGDTVSGVPEKFAKRLVQDMNPRGFKKEEMDLAKAYDCHLFEVVVSDPSKVPYPQKGGEV